GIKGTSGTRAIQEDVASFASNEFREFDRASLTLHVGSSATEPLGALTGTSTCGLRMMRKPLRRSAVALVPAHHVGRRCRIVRARLIQRTLGRRRRRSAS